MNNDYERVAEAIRYLEINYREQPTLDEVAAHVHLSPFHFQRLFRRWAGISPKRFVQYLTVDYAKQQLSASQSVLDAALAAGLSGPGRLHDLFVSAEAMTPGEYKRQAQGMEIRYGFHATPFGDCLLAVTGRGICHLSFVNGGGHDSALETLHHQWGLATLRQADEATRALVDSIFSPDVKSRPHQRLLLKGTNFQLKVWEALLRIPPGSVASYGDVARLIDQPGASRAVGSAVGSNAVAYLIPCHRVIRRSGLVGDYRWGSTRKHALLGWEAAHVHEGAVAPTPEAQQLVI